MKPAWVHAVGLAAPGLATWSEGRGVLTGARAFVNAELPAYQPQFLPPNERRRATPAVRQAFRAAEDAVQGLDPSKMASVFAGSDGDMAVMHRICTALAEPARVISPTDFHNSVHNAAAGYWSIAVGSREASSTVAGHDGSFALGLLDAVTQLSGQAADSQVLLAAFDVPSPEPLLSARPLHSAASCALVLSGAAGVAPLAALEISLVAQPESPLPDSALETLRLGNPALRALPLLRLLARRESGEIVLPCSGGQNLCVRVRC